MSYIPVNNIYFTLASEIIREITLGCYKLFQHNLVHLDLKNGKYYLFKYLSC